MIKSKTILFIVITSLGLAFILDQSVHAAATLQVRPLLVNEKLKVAESKKGYIDIANPTDLPVIVRTSVEAFRQIDNQGNLEFYKSREISSGITPDLDEFRLGPREALRMYYLVEGQKLPEGDVFAAIFFEAQPSGRSTGVNESARVGTLIVLQNGTPGSRAVEVDINSISPIQLGEAVEGRFRLHNPADAQTTSGFFPDVRLQLTPLSHEKRVDGPLLMAGNSRQVDFSLPTDRIGFYKFSVTAGSTTESKWLFVMTGYWRWIVAIFVVFGCGFLMVFRYRKLKLRRGFKKRS